MPKALGTVPALNGVQGHTPVIPVLKRKRQEDQELSVSLGYIWT